MAVDIIVPDMGEHGMELHFVRWLSQEGEAVSVGDPLFEIDTDKTTVEVEAYAAGTLAGLRVAAGDTVQPRQVVGVLLSAGETLESAVGPLLSDDARPSASKAAEQQASPETGRASRDGSRTRATPRARRLAREHGIDLERLEGSGTGGMIVQSDVEAALAVAGASAERSTHAAGEESVVQPRRKVAERTQRSWREIPHFHLRLEVDVTDVLRSLRPTTAVCAAAARALARHPECNLEWTGNELRRRNSVDIGLLVASDHGLLLPTLPRVDSLSPAELDTAIRAAGDRARAGRLAPRDLQPRSLTVSNLGMFSVDSFDAVISAPDVLLLAVGRSRTKPIWFTDTFRPRTTIELTLAVDHRALDGAEAARMLGTLEELLHDPTRLA